MEGELEGGREGRREGDRQVLINQQSTLLTTCPFGDSSCTYNITHTTYSPKNPLEVELNDTSCTLLYSEPISRSTFLKDLNSTCSA